MRQKQLYVAPATEVLELRLEGAILTISDNQRSSGENFSEFEND